MEMGEETGSRKTSIEANSLNWRGPSTGSNRRDRERGDHIYEKLADLLDCRMCSENKVGVKRIV